MFVDPLQARQERERQERERLARIQAEKKRQEKIKAENERQAKLKEEKKRLAKLREEKDRQAKLKEEKKHSDKKPTEAKKTDPKKPDLKPETKKPTDQKPETKKPQSENKPDDKASTDITWSKPGETSPVYSSASSLYSRPPLGQGSEAKPKVPLGRNARPWNGEKTEEPEPKPKPYQPRDLKAVRARVEERARQRELEKEETQNTLKHQQQKDDAANHVLKQEGGHDLFKDFSHSILNGARSFAGNAQKTGTALFNGASNFLMPAAAATETPSNQAPTPTRSSNVANFETQLPGSWDLGKAAVKQQLQEDYYGTKALPNDQQNVLKTGLDWAQHQYQSGQQQAKTWETQLRQSDWGQKIAPVWDGYQKADQQSHALARDFAKGIDPTIRNWTDKAYDFVDQPLKYAEEQTKNIPIIGGITQGTNTLTRAGMQVVTGGVKFAGGFVGGLASLATDPVSALKGIGTMAEHIPPAMLLSSVGGPFAGQLLNKLGVPMVNPLKAMHGAYDVVVNGEDYNTRMRDRVFDPKKSMAEDIKVGKALGSGLIEPMQKSWEQGKYVEAVTQGGLEIASWLVGAGEAKAGSKLSEAGKLVSEAEKAGTIGNKVADASKATKIAEGVKGAEVAKTNQEIGGASKILRDEAGLKLTPERLQMRKNGEALQKSLPKRQQVPVEVDPALHGNTVQVHYSMNKGQITDVHIKAGPEATVRDIQLHGTTVKRMQQYSGLSHHAQLLKDRWTAWRNQHGVPPVGTKAWEAQLELKKLPEIIKDRANRLAKGGLDEKSQLRLEAELSDLKHQMATHEKTFKTMDKDPGKGFVAAQSAGSQKAQELGLPVAEDGYHWMLNDGKLRYDRDEKILPNGTVCPQKAYDPKTKKFVDVDPNIIQPRVKPDKAESYPIPVSEQAGHGNSLQVRDVLRTKRDRLKALQEKDPHNFTQAHEKELSRTIYELNEQSRQIGERGAVHYIQQKYPNAVPEYGGPNAVSRSGDFDQVWKVPGKGADGGDLYVVVEAKGGSSPLGTRKVQGGQKEATQGSKEYFDEIVDSVSKDKKSSEARRVGRDLTKAQKRGDVQYLEVRTPIREDKFGKGTVKETKVNEFDIFHTD
jgi:hypothetical protein